MNDNPTISTIDKPTTTPSVDTPDAPETYKPKILMIDNARMMHGAVKARLSADGMDLYSAYHGEQGLALALTLRPDVILLDVEMPAPNGFEVCRRLKDNSALSNIPVIFLTGASSTDEKVRGLNLGAIDYVTKPFDAAELQARVRAGLRNKELLDLLSKKAMIDGLTGLYNRTYLNQRMIEELGFVKRHHRSLSCIMLDIDHFKTVNDTHGHGFGDVVLKEVSGILQRICRSEDVPCRYGGEEFAILLRESEAAGALLLAERIRAEVAAYRCKRGLISVSVTCSFGVADSHDGGDDLLDRADQALYESKRKGRNQVTLVKQAALAAANP